MTGECERGKGGGQVMFRNLLKNEDIFWGTAGRA